MKFKDLDIVVGLLCSFFVSFPVFFPRVFWFNVLWQISFIVVEILFLWGRPFRRLVK